MSSITALMLLSAAGLATAQTTVLNMFLPGFEGQDLQASVVTAMTKPPSIEYFVQCSKGADDCGLGPGVSVTMAPGSYALGLNEPPALYVEICVFGYLPLDFDLPSRLHTISCFHCSVWGKACRPSCSYSHVNESRDTIPVPFYFPSLSWPTLVVSVFYLVSNGKLSKLDVVSNQPISLSPLSSSRTRPRANLPDLAP